MSIQSKDRVSMHAAGTNISARCFLISVAVIVALILGAYVITLVMPAGQYDRVTGTDGTVMLVEDSYRETKAELSFWKWILSPMLALGAKDGGALISVLVFLLVIGGSFSVLESISLTQYLSSAIVRRWRGKKETLLSLMALLFMALGACLGSFESIVPLVPLMGTLCLSLGWDRKTGLAVSLLAAACGFATGVCNPLSVGVAQRIAGLSVFSGIWLRLLSFAAVYALLMAFILTHAKKAAKNAEPRDVAVLPYDERKARASRVFIITIGVGMAVVILMQFISALSEYTLGMTAAVLLLAGILAALRAGLSWKAFAAGFFKGLPGMLPAVIMLLMASSLKYLLEESQRMDAILHALSGAVSGLAPWQGVLLLYLTVLAANFFIGSGPAKAFLLLPVLVPLARLSGITPQLCVLAFAFGDGFSDMFYPTNPTLMISLGLNGEGWREWIRSTWKYQVLNLLLTAGLLLFGLAVGYGL